MSSKICFEKTQLSLYVVTGTVIVIGIIFYCYYSVSSKYFKKLMSYIKSNGNNSQVSVQVRERGFGPTFRDASVRYFPENRISSYPERRYIGLRDFSLGSQQVGYVFNQGLMLPLYQQRSEHNFYYHVIDGSRNSIRIPLETRRRELYDEDSISIPELGGDFTIKLYKVGG